MTDPPAGSLPLEICICAAIKLVDGRILRCHRHHHGLSMCADMEDYGQVIEIEAQGFVTSRNRFVDRFEGRRLQDAAGIQSAAPCGYRADLLFSEDLY